MIRIATANAGEGSNKDIGETVGQENNGFEHLANISILLAEMSALECTHQGCTGGPGGAKYKTPALEPAMALEMLKMHDKNCHSQVAGPEAGSQKVQLTKIPKTNHQWRMQSGGFPGVQESLEQVHQGFQRD